MSVALDTHTRNHRRFVCCLMLRAGASVTAQARGEVHHGVRGAHDEVEGQRRRVFCAAAGGSVDVQGGSV